MVMPLGGRLEFGKSFEQWAVGEMHEETGLVMEAPTFLAVLTIYLLLNIHTIYLFL